MDIPFHVKIVRHTENVSLDTQNTCQHNVHNVFQRLTEPIVYDGWKDSCEKCAKTTELYVHIKCRKWQQTHATFLNN